MSCIGAPSFEGVPFYYWYNGGGEDKEVFMDVAIYDDFLNLESCTRLKDQKDSYYAFEESPFWGEKGGMPSDKGTVNGMEVLDLKWIDGTLYHKLEEKPSDPIECKVDFETRLINTTVQSALHLMDGFYGRRGQVILAIGTDWDNLWYELDCRISDKELEEAQAYINEAIFKNVPLSLQYVKGQDYPDENYRKYDKVRIVEYPGLDKQPCGTPHLNSTGQIMSFVILSKEKASRGDRIHFTCSLLTDRYLKSIYDDMANMSHAINCKKEEVADRVERLVEDAKDDKKQIKNLKDRLANFEADRISALKDKIICLDNLDGGDLRNIANKLQLGENQTKFLLSESVGKTGLVIVSSDDKARDILNAIQEDCQVRGGGSPKMVTGNSPLGLVELKTKLEQLI